MSFLLTNETMLTVLTVLFNTFRATKGLSTPGLSLILVETVLTVEWLWLGVLLHDLHHFCKCIYFSGKFFKWIRPCFVVCTLLFIARPLNCVKFKLCAVYICCSLSTGRAESLLSLAFLTLDLHYMA